MSFTPDTRPASTALHPAQLVGASGNPSRVLLVASDASAPSDAAVHLAAALERQRGFAPALISVLAPLPSVTPPLGGGIVAVPVDAATPARRRRRREELEQQLRAAGVPPTDWPSSIVVGVPAQEIEDAVQGLDASLVLLGLHRHTTVERMFREDVVMDVVRAASAPTIGVTHGHEALPRRILVAMDFSRAAIRAARTAMSVAADGAEIVLAHVTPHSDRRRSEDAEGEGLVRQLGVSRAFEQLLRDLPAERGLVFTPTVLEGMPTEALLDLAQRIPAELIAVGTHQRTGVERFFLGSVTQALMRAATCSVLASRGLPDRQVTPT